MLTGEETWFYSGYSLILAGSPRPFRGHQAMGMHTAGDLCTVEGTYLKHYFARFKFQQTAALHFHLSIKIRLLASQHI
jgi:hypothetical protein